MNKQIKTTQCGIANLPSAKQLQKDVAMRFAQELERANKLDEQLRSITDFVLSERERWNKVAKQTTDSENHGSFSSYADIYNKVYDKIRETEKDLDPEKLPRCWR